MATPKALNIAYLDKYSKELAKKFCDVFFAPKATADGSKGFVTHINGEQIRNLTPIQQVNRFVAKDLLFRWKAQVDALKSPFFNYNEPEVVQALDNFMNLLSNKIWIQRHDFEPLLRSAICETLILVVAPSTFFNREVDRLITTKVTPVIPTKRLYETAKFYLYNKKVVELITKELDNTKTCDNYAGVLKRQFYAATKDHPDLLYRSTELLNQFSSILPLNTKELFLGEDGETVGIRIATNGATFEPEIRVLTYTDIIHTVDVAPEVKTAVQETVIRPILEQSRTETTIVSEPVSQPAAEPTVQADTTESPAAQAAEPLKVEVKMDSTLVDKEITSQPTKMTIGSQFIFDLNPETTDKVDSVKPEQPQSSEDSDEDEFVSSPTLVSKPITRTKEVSIAPVQEVSKPFTRASAERAPSLQDKLNASPIADLIKAIPPADKYKYIKVLFGNDAAAYEQALTILNHAPDRATALDILLNSYGVPLNWDFNNSAEAKGFLDLIERRHSKRA